MTVKTLTLCLLALTLCHVVVVSARVSASRYYTRTGFRLRPVYGKRSQELIAEFRPRRNHPRLDAVVLNDDDQQSLDSDDSDSEDQQYLDSDDWDSEDQQYLDSDDWSSEDQQSLDSDDSDSEGQQSDDTDKRRLQFA